MHLVNCEHPRFVINPSSGEKVRVRCGKCDTCKNARAKDWCNRLIEESQHHSFGFMVNLTYNDRYLPKMRFDGNFYYVENRKDTWRIPFQEIDKLIDSSLTPIRDRQLLLDRLSDRLGVPVIYTKDVQDFNKRLNKYIHDNITHTYQNFRFFTAFEYGPDTHRSHMHGVYWPKDRRVAEVFHEIVAKVWTFGNSSVAAIYSKGGYNYVAQYVNMSCHLPSFYEHPKLKQRHTFSKCPPIGSSLFLDKEIRNVFDRLPVKRTVWNASSARFDTVPVTKSFKDRFFPKCEGYSNRSDFDRIILYRATEFLPSDDFKEFCEFWYQLPTICKDSGFYFNSPFRHIYERLLDLRRDIHMNSKEPKFVESKLYKIYLVSSRFCYIRDSLGLTSGQCLKRINEYYKKVDYEKLKDFYLFQQDYVLSHPVQDLITAYPEFYDFCVSYKSDPTKESCFTLPWQSLALKSFKISSLEKLPDLYDTYDYKVMKSKNNQIYKDTHKRHNVNDYRYSQRLHDLNPELQSILIKYSESYA